MSIFIDLDELESEYLTLVNDDFNIENGVLKKCFSTDEKVVIPDGVISIADDAFEDSHIREIVFPSTIKSIERFSFSNSAISKITLNFGLEIIHDCAFMGCKNLKEITFPITLKVIGSKAFSNTGIKKVRLPEDILYVASDCFNDTPFKDFVRMQIKKIYYDID